MATDTTKTMATAMGTIATDRSDLSSEARALGTNAVVACRSALGVYRRLT